MKKNAMLKIAAILMVAVLLTTCAISSTFAKYVTSGSDSASARVAKWGVNVLTSLDGIFAEQYADTADTADNVKSLTTGKMVVAPGTNESIDLNATVSGQPEVSVEIENKVEFVFGNGWSYDPDGEGEAQAKEYMPIVFTINTVKYVIGSGDDSNTVYCTNIADLKAKIDAAASKKVTYAAGKDLNNDVSGHDTKIEWSWALEGDNVKDTYLGNAAMNADISITINVTTTVTQTGDAGDALETAAPTPTPGEGN